MRKIIIIVFIAITYFAQAQELPSMPENSFVFPIGSKFTIKLVPTDLFNFDYSVIAFEPFKKIIDTEKKEELFEEEGEDSTIAFYFCMGTKGETEKERDENKRILLIMKSYSKFAIEYTSKIQQKEGGEYEKTQNSAIYYKLIKPEIWHNMVYSISLSEFKKADWSEYYERTIDIKNKTVAEMENIFHERLKIILSDLGKLKINDISVKEQEWGGGVGYYPAHDRFMAGEICYPNHNDYPINKSIEYLYIGSLIKESIVYYATKENGLIRAVSFIWDEAPFLDEEFFYKADTALQNQFLFLENVITKEVGRYTNYEDKKDYISVTWETKSGFTINLYKDKKSHLIDLIIYKD